MKSRLAAVLALACACVAARAADTRVYDFQAALDGKPIGTHRFTVVTDGVAREVTSDAEFTVKILGFSAYHYRHHAQERWRGDCLESLSSTTDDDGKPARVKLARTGEANEITTNSGTRKETGCLMTYAYWNPTMRAQSRLLNPQTGKLDAVTISRVGSGRVVVAGKEVGATDWRITGGESPVDVWISEAGEWVGLDSPVSNGKHTLSYRVRGD